MACVNYRAIPKLGYDYEGNPLIHIGDILMAARSDFPGKGDNKKVGGSKGTPQQRKDAGMKNTKKGADKRSLNAKGKEK